MVRRLARLFRLCFCLPVVCLAQGAGGRPVVQEFGRVPLTIPAGLFSGFTRAASGDLYILGNAPNERIVFHYRGSDGTLVSQFSLSSLSGTSENHLYFSTEVAVDPAGRIYVTGVWRPAGTRDTRTDILVFDQHGALLRTVPTVPRVEARHIAIDKDGYFYVLGVDSGYFNRATDLCMLIHKYSPAGLRITAFSSCPAEYSLRNPAGLSPGPDFPKLNKDVNQGSLWFQNGMIYHALANSRILRAFETSGRQVFETRLQAPTPASIYPLDPTTENNDEVRRVTPLPGGRFMVEWIHSATSGNTRRGTRGVTIHNAAGRILTPDTVPPPGTAIMFSDDEGYSYMLRKKVGASHDLVRIRAEVPE